ncbi:MAG TPA: hypothetical protein PLD27_03920 [bacterium]|mgnify:CR=1 FL=1|nr:hypothetical protein [bacterium]HOL47481.1 hypothetical protein [bacterium]
MNSKYKKFDLTKVKILSIKDRKNLVSYKDFLKIKNLKEIRLKNFVNILPDILMAKELKELLLLMKNAYKKNKPIIIATGAHSIKCGLSPLFIELIRRKMISLIALNGAGVIHDVEIALIGETSEKVDISIRDGSFGMAKETAEFINSALEFGVNNNMGYGEAVGYFIDKKNLKYRKYSLLYNAYKNNVPVTVHIGIGTDIIHQQPSTKGEIIGKASYTDFLIYIEKLKEISDGGIYLNIGSNVILPEVFLKAVTVIRNTNPDFKNFYTANFDMIKHYRPTTNVVHRPVLNGGKGFNFIGHNEIMIPLLFFSLF